MKRQPNATDARLTEKAKLTVEETRAAEGRRWLFPGQKPFKIVIVALYLLGILLLLVMTATFFGLLLKLGDITPGGSNYDLCVNDTVVTGICLALLVGALLCCRFHAYLITGLLCVAEAILFLPSQKWIISDILVGGWKPLLVFSLPTILFTLCGIYLALCDVLQRRRVAATKADFLRRIQAAHPQKEDRLTTAAEWDSYIEEFLAEPVHVRPKRSLKKKKAKAESQEEK